MKNRIIIAYAILLGMVSIIAYISTRSISYDDFDSYNFGLAVEKFDLSLQQPQPPGFPLYVITAQGLNKIIQNPLISLTTLSAISGMVAAVSLFFLGIHLFKSPHTAFFLALIFAMFPIQWLTSVKALSDSSGVMASLLSILFIWMGLMGKKWAFVAGSLVLGMSLGVRPQSNYFGVILFGLGMLWLIIRQKNWRIPLYSLIAVLIGVMIWLIPTLQSVGGLDRYLALIAQHGEHVGTSDSLFSTGTTLQGRINDFLETFFLPTFGLSVYRSLGFVEWLIIGGCGLWLVVGIISADYGKISIWGVMTWFLVMLIPYFLFTSLNRPRLMLPIFPPLLLLAGLGWERLFITGKIRQIVCAIGALVIIGIFISQSLPLGKIISTIPAPHDQATRYIRENYPSDQTAIAVAGSYRTAQTVLNDYRALFYRYQFDPATVQSQIHAENYTYIAILDRDGFGDVMSALDDDGRYVPIDDQLFYRDERVHWEHHQTRLQVLMPLDQLTADKLTLPDDNQIDLADDGKFLGSGWFRGEDIGGVMARWGGDDLTSEIRVTLIPQDYRVEFFATPFVDGAIVSVIVNGEPMGEFVLTGGWNTYTFDLPAEIIVPDEFILIELIHDTMQSPYEITSGASSDKRGLTVAYAWMRFVLK